MALTYSSPTTITISLASLATSATLVAGRECTQIDNTSNLYLDAQLFGSVMVGTTPTANTVIQLFLWGSDVGAATTAIDTIVGADGARTITNVGILQSSLVPGPVGIVSATTSNVAIPIRCESVATALGLPVLPPYWGFFLAHNTAVNLNSTGGNHNFRYVGIKY